MHIKFGDNQEGTRKIRRVALVSMIPEVMISNALSG